MSEQVNINYGYGVTKETSSGESGGMIPPGIQEDVTFVDVSFEKLSEDSDSELLMLNYMKDGAQLRAVLWPITPEGCAELYDKYPPKPVRRKYEHIGLEKGDVPNLPQYTAMQFDTFNSRIKHILNCFLKDEDKAITGDVNSYEELAAKVIEMLTPYFGSKVRLKLTLNKDDYSEIAKFGPFMEYEVPLSESRLKLNPRDRIIPSGQSGGAPGGGAPGAPTANAPTAPGAPGGAPTPPAAPSAPAAPAAPEAPTAPGQS